MNDIQILINYTKQMINDGDYVKARKAILKIISLDPSSERAYSLLGNVYYLMKDKEKALKSYLASAHLLLNKFKSLLSDSFEDVINEKFNNLSEYEKSRMPNKYLIVLSENPTLISELGHAFIDFDCEIDDPIINECIEIYTESLIKDTLPINIINNYNICLEDYNNINISHFVTLGKEYLLDNLKWDSIDDINVKDIYLK